MAGFFVKTPISVLFSGDITSSAKLIYQILLFFARKTDVCNPSIKRICERSGRSKSLVMIALKELSEIGLIEVRRRFNKSSVYHLADVKMVFTKDYLKACSSAGYVMKDWNGKTLLRNKIVENALKSE